MTICCFRPTANRRFRTNLYSRVSSGLATAGGVRHTRIVYRIHLSTTEAVVMADLTVMSWNVENPIPPPADDTSAVDRFQHKLAGLAAPIDREQPDGLVLQEIGTDGALEALQGALSHDMPHALQGIPDGRGIRVAFFSRDPITRQHKIQPFPPLIRAVQARDPVFDDRGTEADESLSQAMGRGALEIGIKLDGVEVTVITAHFKSRLISCDRRKPDVPGSQFSPRDEHERYRYAAHALYRRTGAA